MTYYDQDRAGFFRNEVAGLVNRFIAVAGDVLASVSAWKQARDTRKALDLLTERELEDIGLTRADIGSVADRTFTR